MPNISTLPRTELANATIGTAQMEANAVTGAKLSSSQRIKLLSSAVPTVPTAAGTTEVLVMVPFAGTVTAAWFAAKDALIANDTNFVTFAIKNKGQAGAGTTDVLSTAAGNTTKVTGGSALTGYKKRDLALNGTPANLVVAAGDVLAVQVVGAGTLANTLTEGNVQIAIDVPA